MRISSFHRAAAAVCSTALLAHFGCAPSTPDQLPAAAGSSVAAKADRETWDAYYIQGVKVGHGFTRRSTVREGTDELVRYDGALNLSVYRSGQRTETKVTSMSLETADGQVHRCESAAKLGPIPVLTKGHVDGRRMLIETSTAGRIVVGEIPWSADDRGFFAVEQSLLAKPMKPSDRRTLRVLQPVSSQMAVVELSARDFEQVELPAEKLKLLRIDANMFMPGAAPAQMESIETVYWTDVLGDVRKMFTPTMGLVAYRTTKERALNDDGGGTLDLNLAALVRIDQPLDRPHDARRIRYRVHLDGRDPARSFINGRSQRTAAMDEHTAELTVRAVRPDTPQDGFAADAEPTDDDHQANSYIQSDDPRIVAMAREAAGGETDPWRTAVALEHYVRGRITKKGYSQALATASEVAETLEGDCTEHAVLLAALARARGVPARVAIGLVYVPHAAEDGSSGFLYHMWTEVYVAGGWVGLDGTLGRGGVGPAHLKLSVSSMKDATALTCVLPVAPVLGRLKIDVVDVK